MNNFRYWTILRQVLISTMLCDLNACMYLSSAGLFILSVHVFFVVVFFSSKYTISAKQFGSDQARHFIGHDLGPGYQQMKSHH